MSARQGVYTITDTPTYGGESPNAFVPKVTVEVRVHFPPYPQAEADAIMAFHRTMQEARRKLNAAIVENRKRRAEVERIHHSG